MSFSRLSLQIFSDHTGNFPGLGHFQSAMHPKCVIPQHVLAAGLDIAVPPPQMRWDRAVRFRERACDEKRAPLAIHGLFQKAQILAKRSEGEMGQTLTVWRVPFDTLSRIPSHSMASYLRTIIDFCSTLAF